MRVHHIEVLCKDLKLQVSKFCKCLGFSLYGTWNDKLLCKKKIVLKKNSIYFILHQDENRACDMIDNIALEVDHLKDFCEHLDATILRAGPILIEDGCNANSSSTSSYEIGLLSSTNCKESSFVEAALLKSPVGNLKHTILSKAHFQGTFLPDFVPANKKFFSHELIEDLLGDLIVGDTAVKLANDKHISSLDHITFAVKTDTTFHLMDWYKRNLGFRRCSVNNKEDADGFTVRTYAKNGAELGLRITAMQYYFCSEQSMTMLQKKGREELDVKFIFAESLTDQGPNQVDTFLKENLGPGVQHIGLASDDIFKSVDFWRNNNVPFIIPPRHYYDEINETIKMIGQNDLRKSLESKGILLDVEDAQTSGSVFRYLLQVFTQPIFEKETFFFELIQRNGATGFGAGNITALWRAVDAYLKDKDKHVEANMSKHENC